MPPLRAGVKDLRLAGGRLFGIPAPMRALLIAAALTANMHANPLNEPARPTVPIKTSEDKRKQWKPGEAAHIQGKILRNTEDGLLIKGSIQGVKQAGDLFYIKGASTLNQGTQISVQASYFGPYQYKTAISGSLQTVPGFVPR